MYRIERKNSFKKDYKTAKKRDYDLNLLRNILYKLSKSGKLPAKNRPHKLSGNLKGYWECHITPDWLLIWLQDEEQKKITLVRTGTHSDLFG